MKIQKIIACAALAVMLSGISSCSSESGQVLDTIPADAQIVAMVDVNRLCAESGITFTAEGAQFDPLLAGKTERIADACDMAAALSAGNAADLENVAVFSGSDGESFATFAITSFESFRDACGERVQWADDAEGMHVGAMHPTAWVVASDKQVWITDVTSPAKGVKQQLEAARKNPISGIAGINRQLTSPALVDIAVLSEAVNGNKLRDEALQAVWNVAQLNTADGKLTLNWCRMKGDGEKVSLKGLQEINPAVLAYIESEPTLAVAAGLTSEFDWTSLTRLFSMSRDFQTMAMLQMAMPYLAAIDGTVMIAASPANTEAFDEGFDPGNWKFTVMAHMPQEKINQLTQQVQAVCFTSGVTPVTDPRSGVMTIRNYGLNLHLGNVDGYLAISNHPFSDNGQNELAPLFVNKDAAARLAIPSLQPLGPGLPAYGLNLQATVAGNDGGAELTLPGSEGSPLLNILSVLL